jgi:ABC-2 type transport system ATP-binding protein
MTNAVVQTARLVAHDPWGYVLGLDLALPGGTVGALIGTPQDGIRVLAEVMAGAVRPSSGRILIAGRAPHDAADIRARIGALLDEPALPDVGTVRELLALCRALRGELHDRDVWLEALGVSELLKTRVRELDRRQARSVSLALALLIPSPLLLVLREPLAEVVRADATQLRKMLHEKAEQGACVVVLTGSVADAAALADDVATLQRGRIGRAIGSPDVDELSPASLIEMRVWTNKPRELAAALSSEPSVQSVWVTLAQSGAPVVVQAADVEACAKAVARLVDEQKAELLGMQTLTPAAAQVHEATVRMAGRGGVA